MTASPGSCEGRRIWIFRGTLEAPLPPRDGCGSLRVGVERGLPLVPGSARCPRAGWAAGQDRTDRTGQTGQSLAGGEHRFGLGAHPGVTRWTCGWEGAQVRGSSRNTRERCRKSGSRDLSVLRGPWCPGGCSGDARGCAEPPHFLALAPHHGGVGGRVGSHRGHFGGVEVAGCPGALGGWRVTSSVPMRRGFGAAPCRVPEEPELPWGGGAGFLVTDPPWQCPCALGCSQDSLVPPGLEGNPPGWAGCHCCCKVWGQTPRAVTPSG